MVESWLQTAQLLAAPSFRPHGSFLMAPSLLFSPSWQNAQRSWSNSSLTTDSMVESLSNLCLPALILFYFTIYLNFNFYLKNFKHILYFVDCAITVVPFFFSFCTPHLASPFPPATPLPFSSYPWVIHVSSLASPFPILFLTSSSLFCSYQLCMIPTHSPLSLSSPSQLKILQMIPISMIFPGGAGQGQPPPVFFPRATFPEL